MTGQVCNYPAQPSASVGLAFAPNGRSPSVSLQHQSMPGPNAADGCFNIVSLVFPGELSIPLTDEARDEASFEFDSELKGVFLESFYRKGLSSLGTHLFVDDDRSMGSIIGVYNFCKQLDFWNPEASLAQRLA